MSSGMSINRSSSRRRKMKARMFEECGGRCFYCDRQMVIWGNGGRSPKNAATFEHIKPRAHGGGIPGNLVLACLECNNRRDTKPVEVFKRSIARTPAEVAA